MTDDEIIQLLKEIDMCTHTYSNGIHIVTTYEMTKMRLFAKRVAAAEREACALVAKSYEPRCDTCQSGVANAIRGRKS